MSESDELAVVRGEPDRQIQLKEARAERDRLRAELREALDQLEHWRTLAEYRETVILELRGNTDRRRELPPTGHPAVRSSRRRFGIT